MTSNSYYTREGDTVEKRLRTGARQVQNVARRAPVLTAVACVALLVASLWAGGAFTLAPPPALPARARPVSPSKPHLPPQDSVTGQQHAEAATAARRKLEFAAAPPAPPAAARKRVVALYQAGGRINTGVWPNWGGDPPVQ